MSLGILIIPFVFVLGWIISFFLTQLELNNMQYKFYDTKVEYTDGFLIKNKKNIPYSRITDSMQGQTIVERLFGF